MIRTLILTAAVMVGLATSTSTAQAGPRIGLGFGGVGVGGRNFQLYVGPRGYYGPGYYGGYGYGGYYGPGYYGGYYGPGYYGGTTYYSSPYYAPGQVYSGSTTVTPVVPFGPTAPMFDGGAIVLMNPATNSNSVEYALDGERFVMRPGQSQRFAHDRDWIIEFDRGDGRNFARYGLKASVYKFKPTAQGWELFEQAVSRPSVGALPPSPSTTLPAKPANPPRPADEPRPRDLVPPPVPESEAPKPQAQTEPSDVPETVIRPRSAAKSENSEK